MALPHCQEILENHEKDFKDLVGISSYMWTIVIIVLFLEGYFTREMQFLKFLYTIISLTLTILVDIKLVRRDL